MTLLGGGIAGAFAEIFGREYLPGLLHPMRETSGTGGRLTKETDGADLPMAYQREAMSWAMRQADGFDQEDARFFVLRLPLARAPTLADELTADGRRWSIQGPIGQDPAGAYWDIRARPTEAPTGG